MLPRSFGHPIKGTRAGNHCAPIPVLGVSAYRLLGKQTAGAVNEGRGSEMKQVVLTLGLGLMAVVGFSQTLAAAQVESCPQHFAGGIPPAILKPQLAQGTQMFLLRAICRTAFGGGTTDCGRRSI